jgi:WD40 repeat protein
LATLVYVHAPNPADEHVEITLWDAATDWTPRTFRGTPETFGNAIALSPDGSVFATGRGFDHGEGQPSVITLWDAATGRPVRTGPDGHKARVGMGALAFSPDGKKLLWGDFDGKIKLWDLETGEIRAIEGHRTPYNGVALDPKGRWVASASYGGTVNLLGLVSGEEVKSFPTLSRTVGVAFSPDGRYLAAGNFGSGARVWDLIAPIEPRDIALKGQGNVGSLWLSFSPDGRYLAAGSSNTFKLWELESGESRAALRGHSNQVYWTTFINGGRWLASGSVDRTVRFWEVGGALEERDVLEAHTGGVESLAFTPDGRTLASGGSDGRIRTWVVASGRPLGELKADGITKPVRSHAISRDGRTLADPRLGLWDLETARILEIQEEISGSELLISSAVAFSPVEAIVAMARTGNTRLQDAVTGKVLRSLGTSPLHSVNGMAFWPDGKLLATAGEDQNVTLWEVATGRRLTGNLVGHTGGIQTLAFSPDGKALVSGSSDGTLILWEVSDLTRPWRRLTLEGNAGAVWAVAYAADGATVASGHEDGTVKLWDPATGRERCTLVGHAGRVRTLSFSPDASVLATGDAEGTIRLWRR